MSIKHNSSKKNEQFYLPHLCLKDKQKTDLIMILKSKINHTQFMVPAETVRPFSLYTGSDSPVSMDSSTTLLPERTLPCSRNFNFNSQSIFKNPVLGCVYAHACITYVMHMSKKLW